jgi:hypothetical protein
MLGSVYSVPPRRVSRHTGTDVISKCKIRYYYRCFAKVTSSLLFMYNIVASLQHCVIAPSVYKTYKTMLLCLKLSTLNSVAKTQCLPIYTEQCVTSLPASRKTLHRETLVLLLIVTSSAMANK